MRRRLTANLFKSRPSCAHQSALAPRWPPLGWRPPCGAWATAITRSTGPALTLQMSMRGSALQTDA
eukprot:3829124-Lingulodinium_polyedra.AAC.1